MMQIFLYIFLFLFFFTICLTLEQYCFNVLIHWKHFINAQQQDCAIDT